MSSLWLRHSKVFLFYIFFLPFVSAFELGVSPSEIFLQSFPGKMECKEIHIISSEPVEVILRDFWVESPILEKRLKEYRLKSEDLDIISFYKDKVITSGQANEEICLIAEKSGAYSGVLFVEDSESRVVLAVWITFLSVPEDSILTGRVLSDGLLEFDISERFVLIIGEVLFLLLLTTLFFLLRRS